MKSVFFITFIIISLSSYGQKSMLNDKEIQEVIKEGLEKTYNFEFKSAEAYYTKVYKAYPEHPAYNFLMASNLFWEMQFHDSYKEKSKDYLNYLNKSLKLASKFLEKKSNDAEGVFFTMAVESSLALYFSERNETVNVLAHAKKAYAAMKEGFILKETYTDFYFSTGLYNYFVIKYPETHPVYKPFMFFFAKGNKEKGIKELDYCSKNGIFSRTESLNYLAHIFIKYENDPQKSLIYSEPLVKKYPSNSYFIAQYTEGLIAAQKYKEAEIHAYKLYQTGKKPFIVKSYVFYGLLNEKYFKDTKEAMRYYNAAIRIASELSLPAKDQLSYAYAGLARLYHQQGNIEQAVEYYQKTKEITAYSHIKKEAEDYLDKYD